MLGKFMTALGLTSGQDDGADFGARRTYPRREEDKCVTVIDGQTLPVLDWSPGGVRVFADPRTIEIGREVDIVMKFQIENDLIKVQHRGQIVRKTNDSYAMQFLPLNAELRTAFTSIIDRFNLDAFATSQA